jgi:hypothetical protein
MCYSCRAQAVGSISAGTAAIEGANQAHPRCSSENLSATRASWFVLSRSRGCSSVRRGSYSVPARVQNRIRVRLEGIEPPALRSGDPCNAAPWRPRRASMCLGVFAGRDTSPCRDASRWGIGRNLSSRCDPLPAAVAGIFRREGASGPSYAPLEHPRIQSKPAPSSRL